MHYPGLDYIFHAISIVGLVWVQEVINSYHNDPIATTLLQELAVVHTNEDGYSLSNGVIRYKNKIWIGQNSAPQTKLITSFHGSELGVIQEYKQHITDS
jgi:hypothetical protein